MYSVVAGADKIGIHREISRRDILQASSYFFWETDNPWPRLRGRRERQAMRRINASKCRLGGGKGRRS